MKAIITLLALLLGLIAGEISPTVLFNKSFNLSGTFHPYPFYPKEDPRSAFNWVFKTPCGITYQMMGNPPSQKDVFGWKRVEVENLGKPVWDFYYIGDLDKDGDTRFDFILTKSAYLDKVYKLLPVPPGSFFKYQDLGYFNMRKTSRQIIFNEGNVQYIDKYKSYSQPPFKILAITSKEQLEEVIENFPAATQEKLKKVDLDKYNLAVVSFYLNGSETYTLGKPDFSIPNVVTIPIYLAVPEVGIMVVVYHTVIVAVDKGIQRVVFKSPRGEMIVNFSQALKSDCSQEPIQPVCALIQVRCVTTPCDPIPQTFNNYCELKNDPYAQYLHMGSCDEKKITSPDIVATSLNSLSAKLMRKLYNKENLLISPFSIFSALNMVYLGASKETKEEFEQFFNYPANVDIPLSLKTYLEEVTPRYNTLEIANSAWFEKRFKVYKSYEGLVRDFLKSELFQEDFLNSPEEARENINLWVEEKTHQKIRNLLPKGSIKSNTRAVLVNAIYFLGEWQEKFEEVKKEPFTLLDGNKVEVEMMSHISSYNLSQGRSFKAVELPYKENELSMWVLLPNESIEEVLEELEQEGVSTLYKNLTEVGRVEVKLPKFKLEWGTKEVGQTLQELGLKRVFDKELAQLEFIGKPINEDANLYLNSVFHKTFIEVNEQGSEAAAATAGVIVETSAVPIITPFYVDRPFLFLIVENRFKTPLFSGVVTLPSQ